MMLFNLDQDPGETTDLAGDPAYTAVLEQLQERVAYHRKRAVPPLRAPLDLTALPEQVFATDWCQSVYDPRHP